MFFFKGMIYVRLLTHAEKSLVMNRRVLMKGKLYRWQDFSLTPGQDRLNFQGLKIVLIYGSELWKFGFYLYILGGGDRRAMCNCKYWLLVLWDPYHLDTIDLFSHIPFLLIMILRRWLIIFLDMPSLCPPSVEK